MSEDNEDGYITHKTGLSIQDEIVVKDQMLILVRKDVTEFAKKNKDITLRIENIKRIPKISMHLAELEDVLMNLKIIKIDIDELMTDLYDTNYSKSLSVTELALKKKALKLLKFNMEMITRYLDLFEKALKSKLRFKLNVFLAISFLLFSMGLYLWLKN